MIGVLSAKLSGRGFLIAIVIGLGCLCFLRGIAHIDAMVEAARIEARAERDAHWRGEIARADAEAAAESARLAIKAAAADMAARGEIERLSAQLNDLEKINAALPGAGACGLDRERVRLLAR